MTALDCVLKAVAGGQCPYCTQPATRILWVCSQFRISAVVQPSTSLATVMKKLICTVYRGGSTQTAYCSLLSHTSLKIKHFSGQALERFCRYKNVSVTAPDMCENVCVVLCFTVFLAVTVNFSMLLCVVHMFVDLYIRELSCRV